jgi:hypothetical protein
MPRTASIIPRRVPVPLRFRPLESNAQGLSTVPPRQLSSTLLDLSDPSLNEAPIATLQVWQSTTCHAWFASASTSTLLGLQGPYTLTVSLTQHLSWWQNALRETSVKSRGEGRILHAWTPLLSSNPSPPETIEACLSIAASTSYHVCTTVSLQRK